jgi:hypothetical protein
VNADNDVLENNMQAYLMFIDRKAVCTRNKIIGVEENGSLAV